MDFRTVIQPTIQAERLKHSDKILMLGSCFTDNIGSRLKEALMNVVVNPFGTVYNPASIENAINRIVNQQLITNDELIYNNGLWHSFSFHSSYSSADADRAIAKMNDSISEAHNQLLSCHAVIITLGTSMIYVHNELKQVVSNCHKLPAKTFERTMLHTSTIVDILSRIVDSIKQVNSNTSIIFTVSPIRHIADGLECNNLSKSRLRVAIGDIIEKYPNCCSYFPSFEIMNDDLRDYRFYAADMVHPSDVAVDYISKVFLESYFDATSLQAISKCTKLSRRMKHRPMSDNEDVVKKFLQGTVEEIEKIKNEYPYVIIDGKTK